MKCISMNEPLDQNGWHDNALCVPKTSPYTFSWVNNGITFLMRHSFKVIDLFNLII